MTARLKLKGITKRFPQVIANDDVSLEVQPGEVHAILGENGAGKTTLMEIAFGLYQPDHGSILIDGTERRLRSPRDAMDLGIGMVHQHFTLVPTLTVAENIALELRTGRPWVRAEPIVERLTELSASHGLAVPPRERVENLSVGVLQRVEILKALFREARILILDEPTALLTPIEVGQLFGVMRSLASEGRSIVFISHKLREVLEIADRISVLRNGRLQGTIEASGSDESALAKLMVGDAGSLRRAEEGGIAASRDETPLIRVTELTVVDRKHAVLRNLGFEVRPGEILGVAGVEGNGQRELVEALVGLRPIDGGSVEVCGTAIARLSHRQVIELGVGFIPPDRQTEGLVSGFSVAENLMLRHHLRRPFAKWGFLRKPELAKRAAELAARFGVAADIEERIGHLSGGNQQKVVLARELHGQPRVIVAAQPTRGLDISAERYVHDLLRDHRSRGAAIILVSTNLDEVLDLSDRIAVMYEGTFVGEAAAERADRSTIGLMMAGRPPSDTGANAYGADAS